MLLHFVSFVPSSSAIMTDNFAHLLPPSWKKHVQLWLEDDIPSFDIGGFVVGGALRVDTAMLLPPPAFILVSRSFVYKETQETAFLLGKSRGLLAGVPFFTGVCLCV